MAFIQIFECRTTEYDKLRKLDDEWEQSTRDVRTARRSILCRDHQDPERYFNLIFFDSYDSAMENSNLPETQAVAEKLGALVGSPVFYDLDVIEDRS